MNWEAEAEQVEALAHEWKRLQDAAQAEELALQTAAKKLRHARQGQEVLQGLAQAVQQKAHERLSRVVSSCLSSVFTDPYEFDILFERKRGKTEASLRFRRQDLVVDPLSASGGGVVDVAAFALRVACLVMHRPRLSPVVIMDEPFKFVSVSHQEAVRDMLEQLAEELKIQIVYITHNENLATGKIIDL